jgi:ectoine hydroxylase-related dioxygenase (phytanoyl-CoA dioxygenase family)
LTPDRILANPPKVISQDQREAYFHDGYLLLESFIDDTWLERLWQVTETFIDQSRELSRSNSVFDLEDGHSSSAPRLRRLSHPVEQHPLYKEFAFEGPLVDLAEDLLGADVVYHHSKLNFKWAGGGEEVKWHQDIQFWPHTNYSPLTFGLCLSDIDDAMGPMGVIRGSHQAELFELCDDQGAWTGAISDADLDRVPLDDVVWLKGPRGSVTVHNCRMVHGSQPNQSERMRPLLLHTYAAADALSVTDMVAKLPHSETLVRGQRAQWIDFDSRPCPNPPDFSKGYTSIFEVQQREQSR